MIPQCSVMLHFGRFLILDCLSCRRCRTPVWLETRKWLIQLEDCGYKWRSQWRSGDCHLMEKWGNLICNTIRQLMQNFYPIAHCRLVSIVLLHNALCWQLFYLGLLVGNFYWQFLLNSNLYNSNFWLDFWCSTSTQWKLLLHETTLCTCKENYNSIPSWPIPLFMYKTLYHQFFVSHFSLSSLLFMLIGTFSAKEVNYLNMTVGMLQDDEECGWC